VFDNKILLISISTLVTAIPVAIWSVIFFKHAKDSKFLLLSVFILGSLTPWALLEIQELWIKFPQLDVPTLIETSIKQTSIMYMLTFMFFGMMEEVIKHFAVRIIDKKTIAIKTVNDALRFSILAALGFSFSENIYYLYNLWGEISTAEIAGVYIFRSVFTMCAHMIFSGIFGYYFGISKFTIDITKQEELTGGRNFAAKILSKIFNIPYQAAYKEKTILKGLFLAMGIHAVFNFLLQFNAIIPVMVIVILGYLFLRYFLKRKAGHLVLLTDISETKKSMLAKKDEDVVLELLGMWFQDKRYVDVIHVCERLLQRDPDNNVIKLFKEKALDKIEDKNTYKKILQSVFKGKEDISENDRNILTKYIEQKKA